jgi:hypothetical protein
MPLAPTTFDEQNRPTRQPSYVWLVLKCGHEKMVPESETYPVGSFAVCYACAPPMERIVVWRRAIGEPRTHGGRK